MRTHPSPDTHDIRDSISRKEQLDKHQNGYMIQDHINSIGETIIETNEHNRYVRQVLHDHLIPGGYCRISCIDDRRTIHYAYAICNIARDVYNSLCMSIPPLKKHSSTDVCSVIDAQTDMLQNTLELLEKDIQIALHHMK